ncbi:MAG TPA: alpha-amylase family glycosyl hydrolase [Flavitalea sp.]|nr:alpha-amylase family glycosyl hydrolase [Flavitalea sp.]
MPKFYLLFGLVICHFCSVNAQLLTTYPYFPRDNSTLIITVDCSKGNRGLFNYTDSVYVHVGVILGSNPTPWDSVKFTWATANPLAKATYLGNNKFRYVINNIRAFFNVPANVPIRKVAILFRDAAGNLVQRNSDGSDMYIQVYDATQAVKFVQPWDEPRFVPIPEPVQKNPGDILDINFQSNNFATLKLFYNGTRLDSIPSDTALHYSLIIPAAGPQQLIGIATNASGTFSDTVNFFIAPPVTVVALPPGVRDGINYEQGDTSVILVLQAPLKTRVSVVGDFNNWTESVSSQMNKTPDGQRFWIRIKGLTPGAEYAYQYLVDNSIRIADPYTQKVLDPVNDPFIPISVYPGLKPYPTGKTSGIVSILQTAEPSFSWQVNNFVRPDKRNLLIYELLLRDFIADHDWKTLKDTVAYIKRMGINAIELMPFNEFEGNISWGYNPSFYFAPDKYYGTKTRLKEFIDECHKQGIAVIMDIALNHSFGQSPMVQLYFSNGRPDSTNPWFNPYPRHAFNVGYDMNHQSLATRSFTSRVVEHWLQEYKIDGFRFDLSKGFTQVNTCDNFGNNCNVGQWGSYDSSRVAIWKRYYDTVQQKSPGAYVILEHFADNSEEIVLSDYGMMLWGNVNGPFSDATKGVATANVDGALFTVRGWSKPHLIGYMESHDEERITYRSLQEGLSSGGYNIRDLNTALRRDEMSASFLLLMPGPKMVWQFGETGYDFSINRCQDGSVNNNCRLDPKPIKWDYLQQFSRKRLYEVYAALLKLRNHPLYKDAFVSNRVSQQLNTGVKWLKIITDTSNLMVIGNFDITSVTTQISFPGSGTWYDYLTGQTFSATGGAQSITLQAGEYHVYLNRNVTSVVTPVGNIPVRDRNFSLHVQPNPVAGSATINFEIPQTGPVSISLINVAGEKVATLFSGVLPAGSKTIYPSFYINGLLTSGIYFIRLQTGTGYRIQKVIIK